ncbi:hypothetical protein ACROYT_G009831 [Oculina patagonica]
MAYQDRYGSQSRRIVHSSMTSTTTKTTSIRSQRSSLERSEVKMEMNGSRFGSHDIKMFSRQEHSSMTESKQWNSSSNRGINYSSFNQRSLISDMIGGGKALTGGRSGVEHSTTSLGHPDESPVEVVQKERPQVETPEWLEERSSPETKRRNPEVLDIDIFLSYPRGHSPKRNQAPDPRKVQYESAIRPEVAKRDQSVPMLRPEDFEDEDDDDDEFEEVFIVVNVQKSPLWRKGLEKPKPEPPKIGKPIHDLLAKDHGVA